MKNQSFREIFDNPIEFADILGLPRRLMTLFSVIWKALRCGLPLDPVKFREKYAEFKKLYYDTIPWAYMCPSMHKVVDHFHVLLNLMPKTLSVSMLSEEAAEGVLEKLLSKMYKIAKLI